MKTASVITELVGMKISPETPIVDGLNAAEDEMMYAVPLQDVNNVSHDRQTQIRPCNLRNNMVIIDPRQEF